MRTVVSIDDAPANISHPLKRPIDPRVTGAYLRVLAGSLYCLTVFPD